MLNDSNHLIQTVSHQRKRLEREINRAKRHGIEVDIIQLKAGVTATAQLFISSLAGAFIAAKFYHFSHDCLPTESSASIFTKDLELNADLQFLDKWASEDQLPLERFQPIGTYQLFSCQWTAVSKTNLQSAERKAYLVYRPTRPSLTLSRSCLSSLPKYRQKPSGRDAYLAGVLTTNLCCHLNIWHNFIFCHHCFRRFRFCSRSYRASLLSFHTCTLCFRCVICHVNYLYIHIAFMNTMHQQKKEKKRKTEKIAQKSN